MSGSGSVQAAIAPATSAVIHSPVETPISAPGRRGADGRDRRRDVGRGERLAASSVVHVQVDRTAAERGDRGRLGGEPLRPHRHPRAVERGLDHAARPTSGGLASASPRSSRSNGVEHGFPGASQSVFSAGSITSARIVA